MIRIDDTLWASSITIKGDDTCQPSIIRGSVTSQDREIHQDSRNDSQASVLYSFTNMCLGVGSVGSSLLPISAL